MVVEEIEMSAGETVDLRERIVDVLGVKPLASLEERFLVTEVAAVGTSARHDNGIGNEVQPARDEIASDAGKTLERAHRGAVRRLRDAGAEVIEKARPRVLAGTDENRIRVGGRLLGQGGDVQPAHRDVYAATTIVVGDLVRSIGRRDVYLDDDELGTVVEVQRLDVLVMKTGLVVFAEVPRERGQSQRRKQGVLDGTEEGALGLREGGENELDAHARESVSDANYFIR